MKKARLADSRVARIADRMKSTAPADVEDAPLTGSRGGRTTVTAAGLLRKTCYLAPDEWRALRVRAAEDESNASEVIRAAVREYLNL